MLIKNKIVVLLTMIGILFTMISCANQLTLVVPKDAKLHGNLFSEEGLTLGKKVELQGNYKLQRDSDNSVLLMAPNGVNGTFSCGCVDTADEVSGCIVIIGPNRIACLESVCKECEMKVIIKSFRPKNYKIVLE